MYICDRLAERERVILVTIFVAIRYRVSTVYRVREISLFLKNMVPGTHGGTRCALCINLFLLI